MSGNQLITPGAIVVLTGAYVTSPEIFKTPHYVPWPLYIPLFGLFFIMGFGLQCLGEWLRLVNFYPDARSSARQVRAVILHWSETCEDILAGNDSTGFGEL